jgi:hypothetical protein
LTRHWTGLLLATLKPCLYTVQDRIVLVADGIKAAKTGRKMPAVKVIRPLLKAGQHLIAAVRFNAVAYEPAPPPEKPRRGRRRTYGTKVKLKTLFEDSTAFVSAPSPVYGETDVVLRYRFVDLLWRPLGRLVRFVLVIHPQRGRKILLSTDLSLAAMAIIALFNVRFKIAVSFKQAIYTSTPRRSGPLAARTTPFSPCPSAPERGTLKCNYCPVSYPILARTVEGRARCLKRLTIRR